MRVVGSGEEKRTAQRAVAVRFVGILSEMETMWAVPVGETWVSLALGSGIGMGLSDWPHLLLFALVVEKRRTWDGKATRLRRADMLLGIISVGLGFHWTKERRGERALLWAYDWSIDMCLLSMPEFDDR